MQPTIKIVPTINYREPHKALDFLSKAFGFDKKVVFEDDNGVFVHGEMTYKGNMIMMGSYPSDTDWGKQLIHPDEIGQKVTFGTYVIVDDEEMEAHYEQAKNAGAQILVPLKKEDYGGQSYLCKDLEGYLWNFGSYDPWSN